MPWYQVECRCLARVPSVYVNLAGLLLSMLTGYFAYQGVSSDFKDYVRDTCPCDDSLCGWENTVNTGQWAAVGVAVLVMLFPWSSCKEYLSNPPVCRSALLGNIVLLFSAAYVLVTWVLLTVGFWSAIYPRDYCDQVMYKPLWEYQPYYVVLISIFNIPVYLVVAAAVLVLLGYLTKLYITKAWCSVKVTKLEHSAVPPTANLQQIH